MATAERVKPNGLLGKFWIVGGAPNQEFEVPWLSDRWMKIKEKEQDGSLQHEFPHMRGRATASLAKTNEIRDEITCTFNSRGEYVTEEEDIAKLAVTAAKQANPKGGGLHPFSLPLPEEEKKGRKNRSV